MKKNYRKFFISLTILGIVSLFIFPQIILGQSPAGGTSVSPAGGSTWEMKNPLKADTFTELLENIIDWATGIASTVAVLMVVIAGFQYMLSGGDENKTKSAMNNIKWSLIGLLIVLMSWAILKEVLSILSA